MEKRDEIKEGVKNRIIDFMAEQITNEDSFLELKKEMVEEFLKKKPSKEMQEKFTNLVSLRELNINTLPAKKTAHEIREENKQKIEDLKSGKSPIDLKTFMDTELDKDSSTYKELFDLIEAKNIKNSYKPEDGYIKLWSIHEKESMERITSNSLTLIQKLAENPIDKNFGTFEIKSYSNGDNYYKVYRLENIIEKFKFRCSYVYNYITKESLIDKITVDRGGFILNNEELGIPFAIQSMEILDKVDAERQKMASFLSDTTSKEIPEEVVFDQKNAHIEFDVNKLDDTTRDK